MMTQKICDCGKPANDSGYCASCLEKVNAQIRKEIQFEELSVKSGEFHMYEPFPRG
jgi:hypothetical protein